MNPFRPAAALVVAAILFGLLANVRRPAREGAPAVGLADRPEDPFRRRPSPDDRGNPKIPPPAVIPGGAAQARLAEPSSTPTPAVKPGTVADVSAASARVRAWLAEAGNGPPPPDALVILEGLLRERRGAMERLMEAEPETALEMALTGEELERLPAGMAAWAERRIEGRGDLEVLCAYPEPGREGEGHPVKRYVILEGERFRAWVFGDGLRQPTRRDIPLQGLVLGDRMVVENHWEEPDEAPAPATALMRAAAAGGEESPVLKRLLFIRVDFSDLPGESMSSNRAVQLVRELHRFYLDNSYGRAGYAEIGQGSAVTPVFRMPRTAASYGSADDAGDLRTDARAASRAAGYELTGFDLDVTFVGSVPGFGWAGLGFVGAPGAWVRGTTSTGVTAHELGHNFGLSHANFWDTGGASTGGDGVSVEYGDKFDTMGAANAGRYHFNARYKRLLGWLREGEYTVVTTNGVYRLHAHDQTNRVVGSRGLQVFANARTNYWIELRQQFTTLPAMMNGVGLRWSGRGSESSVLLDTTPGSSGEKDDAALQVGRTFSDVRAGVHVTPLRKGEGNPAWMEVAVFRGEFRDNRIPVLRLLAGATQGVPGADVAFQLEATDADGDELAYAWDFGDGTLSTNASQVVHRWVSAGDYRVVVTASDLRGGVAYAAVVVRIGTPATFRAEGTVTVEGEPAAGVRVTASQGRSTMTDSSGRFALVGLARGTYTLAAIAADGTRFDPVRFANPVALTADRDGLDFSYAETGGQQSVTLVASGSQWNYWDRGTLPGALWKEVAFDDSAWETGAAILGYGGDRETTVIGYGPSASSKHLTAWFRKPFEVRDPAVLQRATLGLLRDDGAVVYLNGSELLRDNMPAGTVAPGTTASGAVNGEGETTYYEFEVDPTLLRAGTNVLAVEVHQSSATSSDTAFDLRLTAETSAVGEGELRLVRPLPGTVYPSPARIVVSALAGLSGGASPSRVRFLADGVELFSSTSEPYIHTWFQAPLGEHVMEAVAEWADGRTATSEAVTVSVSDPDLAPWLIPRRSVWRYQDSGVAPAADWALVSFDDALWGEGPARLGYGEDGEATLIDWGDDPMQRRVTTWFRRAFEVRGVETITNLMIRVQRDDGVLVRLNGTEVLRLGLRSGDLTPAVLASTDIRDEAEQSFVERVVPVSTLVEGRNVVAVEVHQASSSSSDLGFDLELQARRDRVPEIPVLTALVEASGGLKVSWSARFPALRLESAPVLGDATAWREVEGSAVLSGDRYAWRGGLGGEQRYFRLAGGTP